MGHSTEPVYVLAARKRHRCDWCWERIEVGQPYKRWRWYDSGDASTVRVHPECSDAISACDPRDMEDGWMPGDNPRGCNCGGDAHCNHCAGIKLVRYLAQGGAFA